MPQLDKNSVSAMFAVAVYVWSNRISSRPLAEEKVQEVGYSPLTTTTFAARTSRPFKV
jgi:hypothetical protein